MTTDHTNAPPPFSQSTAGTPKGAGTYEKAAANARGVTGSDPEGWHFECKTCGEVAVGYDGQTQALHALAAHVSRHDQLESLRKDVAQLGAKNAGLRAKLGVVEKQRDEAQAERDETHAAGERLLDAWHKAERGETRERLAAAELRHKIAETRAAAPPVLAPDTEVKLAGDAQIWRVDSWGPSEHGLVVRLVPHSWPPSAAEPAQPAPVVAEPIATPAKHAVVKAFRALRERALADEPTPKPQRSEPGVENPAPAGRSTELGRADADWILARVDEAAAAVKALDESARTIASLRSAADEQGKEIARLERIRVDRKALYDLLNERNYDRSLGGLQALIADLADANRLADKRYQRLAAAEKRVRDLEAELGDLRYNVALRAFCAPDSDTATMLTSLDAKSADSAQRVRDLEQQLATVRKAMNVVEQKLGEALGYDVTERYPGMPALVDQVDSEHRELLASRALSQPAANTTQENS